MEILLVTTDRTSVGGGESWMQIFSHGVEWPDNRIVHWFVKSSRTEDEANLDSPSILVIYYRVKCIGELVLIVHYDHCIRDMVIIRSLAQCIAPYLSG